MQQIQVTITAYGAVERLLPKDLKLDVAAQTAVAEVLAQVQQAYPDAAESIERCACAIGEDIIPRQQRLDHNTDLVLLSPVAGG